MNAKKCKLLRKVLKKGGVDWQDAKHVQQVGKDHEGKEIRDPRIFLDPKCGRAIYRASKTLARSKRL
tara:strand:- start:256 stop:456 length:201 start_codon:yes stop_codon:yes gene_type:complete